MIPISALLLSLFITICLVPIFSMLAIRFGAVDLPEPRKVHIRPVPRIGGAAIALGVYIPVLFWATTDNFVNAYMAGGGILIAFGLADDLKGINYKWKFLGQLLATLVIVFYGGVRIKFLGSLLPEDVLLADWLAVPLTLIVIIGVTNAINLADGLDGLAGGISLMGFCCIAYFAYLVDNDTGFLLSLALTGAIFGFLRFNTYPASVFMGDTGSQLLGFSAIVFAVKITQDHTSLSPVLPLIILGFPILDTLTVMVERLWHGRSPFSPDKNHFHHRLMSLGFFHTEAVVVIYLIQSAMIIFAIFFRYHYAWLFLSGYLLFSTALIGAFTLADNTGFRIPRYHLIDHIIKGKLRRIKSDNLIIRISFEISKMLLPLMFLFNCLLPATVPGYASTVALSFGVFLAALWVFSKKWMGLGLRLVLYLTIPLALYFGEGGKAAWISSEMLTGYHLLLIVSTFFVILSIKFSRRMQGFRVTPLDFLIIFIAVTVPNLPDPFIRSQHLGALAVELIVLLFGYEVLITELRGKFDTLVLSTLVGLAIIGIRGL
jgi:UDP-GlcNAc:undecaprenyl-phosphate/decaprenyl-phosphate GlcNAc-1-phosphate transferase